MNPLQHISALTRRRPASFAGLLVSAFILVVAPAVIAFVDIAWQAADLAQSNRESVATAAEAARLSRSLMNRASALERMTIEHLDRDSEELAADRARVRAQFALTALELGRLPQDREQAMILARALAREAELERGLSSTAAVDRRAVGAFAAALTDDLAILNGISVVVAERAVEKMGVAIETLQSRLYLGAALSVLVALALGLGMTRLVAHPIHVLDRAMRAIGRGDLSHPVRIAGPRDLSLLGERVDWLRQRLFKLEEERTRFLRRVSHDLKTPLHVLREGTAMLGEEEAGPLGPRQRKLVGVMQDSGMRLQHHIDYLLSRQGGQVRDLPVMRRPVDLERLIRSLAQAHGIAGRAKGVELDLHVTSMAVSADEQRLRSAIDNLLGNAMKYTPAGGRIQVLASVLHRIAAIDVIDSGPGIPAGERAAVFEAHFRGRAARLAKAEGQGLGLAIVREVAREHGGSVELLDSPRGAHFRLLIPAGSGALREAA